VEVGGEGEAHAAAVREEAGAEDGEAGGEGDGFGAGPGDDDGAVLGAV